MDWNLAIERNREALKRIVATLVAMAGPAYPFTSALSGGRRTPDRRVGVIAAPQPPADLVGKVKPAFTLSRRLHRAILRLLRPAESAVRRLVIVMARGLVVTLPAPRPGKPTPAPTFLRRPGGTGILMPPGSMSATRPWPRMLALPLLDPLKHSHRRRPGQTGVPRISLPGVTVPFPVAPRYPPAPGDLLDATRLALRLQSLGAALDDLPRLASRFARWRMAGAGAAGTRPGERRTGRARRVWPLRPGRPPGQRPANRRTHDLHQVLNDLHGLAFDALEHPDTS
ncbi:MAG TPA: hypothetical protein VIZ90_19005 [Rhizobiaceae bacterium]